MKLTDEQIQEVFGVNDAIEKLRPGAIYSLYNNNFTSWWHKDGLEAPAWEDIMAQVAIDEENYKKLEYARKRVEEYPKATEQVDDLWHAINSGKVIDQTSEWFKTIKEIKEKYPKPE